MTAPATPIRLDQITAADWQPKLGEIGVVVVGLDDVDQCVRAVLSTPLGSVPHRPDFGSDLWRYIDWPVSDARPHVVREVVDAIARWEPRVEIVAVTYGPASSDPTTVTLEITRRLRGATTPPSVLAFRVSA